MRQILPEEGFCFDDLVGNALCQFREVPKATSFMWHTTYDEITESFCVRIGGKVAKIFIPKQILHSVKSKQGGNFLFLRIALEGGKPARYWLMICHEQRQGFLFNIDFVKYQVKNPFFFLFRLLPSTVWWRAFSGISPFFV